MQQHTRRSETVLASVHRIATVLTALLVALVALAPLSCAGGSSGEESQEASADPAAGGDAGDGASDQAAGAPSGEAPEAGEGAPVAAEVRVADDAGRSVVRTGTLEMEVDDLPAALSEAARIVEAAGGFVGDEEVQNPDVISGGSPSARATYRVPPESFRRVTEELGDLGEVRSQHVDAEDVGASVADLDSRIATLETSIARLREFLARTDDVNQIAMLEAELTRRESETASTQAQRRALGDQVALATISVGFRSSTAAAPVDERPVGFAGGLGVGMRAAETLGRAIAATAGFLLPFLPVLALVVLGLVVIRRHRRDAGPSGIAVP